MPSFIIAGLIALGVAVADEIYQIYVPGRKASATDILLDTIGIALALLIFYRTFKPRQTRCIPDEVSIPS